MELRHYDHDGRARFVTFCTHKRIPFLTNAIFRRIVIKAISETREQVGFRLLGYVIMPEHVHLILIPRLEVKLGTTIGDLKRVAALKIVENLRREDGHLLRKLQVFRDGILKTAVWQRRCFDHNCRSDSAMWEKVEYCHRNPVVRGLVRSPQDWTWSSFRWYQGCAEIPLEMDNYKRNV